MSNCQVCDHGIANHGPHGCYVPACECHRTHRPADHPTYKELARENADLRAKLAAAEKARDEQAEAVTVLARRYWSCVADRAVGSNDQTWADDVADEIKNSPTAAAAVKEASGG